MQTRLISLKQRAVQLQHVVYWSLCTLSLGLISLLLMNRAKIRSIMKPTAIADRFFQLCYFGNQRDI